MTGPPIVLFTDFGPAGPYVGQMKAVLHEKAPDTPVIDLIADAPAHNPQLSAYLLAAYAPDFPDQSIFLCVVDPGVGGDRRAAILETDRHCFVGPDNGLLAIIARRARHTLWREITWQPPSLSASFHGRDLFAPVAAMIANGEPAPGKERQAGDFERPDWPDDFEQIIYIDHFGNAMTGIRAATLSPTTKIHFGDHAVSRARTFSDVPPGQVLWYENANGLAEIAVNGGRADSLSGLSIGTIITLA